jgi:hypothetical protein
VAIVLVGVGLWFARGLLPDEQQPVSPIPEVSTSTTVPPPPPPPPVCTVPNLIGLQLDDAESVANDAGFQLDARLVEDGRASGEVIDQDRRPGVEAECDSVITVQWSGIG